MNNVQLVGRITRDIELKRTQGGKAYCNFSIAVTRKYKREEADFINCLAWDKTAELIKNVKKGDPLAVSGRLQIDKKDDTYYTKVVVDEIEFLKARDKNETSATQNQKQTEEDDDFPF